MKKIIIFVLCFSFLGFFPVNAIDSYIYDNAKILDDDTEDYIELYSEFMQEAEEIDYVVYTIKNSENLTLEEYADYLYSELEISEKGLLILVSKDERSLRIKTGSLLSNTISEDVINEYIEDFFLPSLVNDDWDTGIKNGYSAFYKLLCNYYEIDSSSMIVYDPNSFLIKYKNGILIFEVFLCVFLGHFLFVYFNKLLKAKKASSFLDYFILIGCICLNICTFIFAFNLMKNLIWVLMGFELISIISEYQSTRKNTKKSRKKVSKR